MNIENDPDVQCIPAAEDGERLRVALTLEQSSAVLAALPDGTLITRARFFNNYNLPCPIRVDVVLPDGSQDGVVVRTARHGEVETEADLLDALASLGLPVPRVLSRPQPGQSEGEAFSILSLLPGENLQALGEESAEKLVVAKNLLIEGVSRLASVTQPLEQLPVARSFPRRSLARQLKQAQSLDYPWNREPDMVAAFEELTPVLAAARLPLVFTNGDYQPGNFLAQSDELTGFLDFEDPAFQDPLIGFTKYPIYDLHPFNKAGVVADFLARQGYSTRDFAPRLALGCVLTLQKEIPVSGGSDHDQEYRGHVLRVLHQALAEMR